MLIAGPWRIIYFFQGFCFVNSTSMKMNSKIIRFDQDYKTRNLTEIFTTGKSTKLADGLSQCPDDIGAGIYFTVEGTALDCIQNATYIMSRIKTRPLDSGTYAEACLTNRMIKHIRAGVFHDLENDQMLHLTVGYSPANGGW